MTKSKHNRIYADQSGNSERDFFKWQQGTIGGAAKMANRRMFSLNVINTDNFLEMPSSAQCLYFHLGMRADDDGFVSSPKMIAKIANCSTDDLKILATKGYIIPFENGVIVITHWKQSNSIPKDSRGAAGYWNGGGRAWAK